MTGRSVTLSHAAILAHAMVWFVGVKRVPSRVHGQHGILIKPEQCGVRDAQVGIQGVSSSA